ncbi:hypothetical protein QE411_000323 [Microbacterium arborescens]|nr:hypothetical protein [Microbacterium arborescens]
MMTKGREMERMNPALWVVLSLVGLGLVVWGITSGSVAFTLAPAVLTIGCVSMAVIATRKRRVNTHS